ncbi:Retrovirus-related Pol polyprotein like [Argiope bruennichi]|uniref:Retrovirus-related Pol polyprotein like n=1 Tax=Argiope bruennichi TaxID=94029 RepID=A0A8T0F8J0_ARGBR|nr:Retrovirus-related Pol polyprotein like [Argiope bruennichi]
MDCSSDMKSHGIQLLTNCLVAALISRWQPQLLGYAGQRRLQPPCISTETCQIDRKESVNTHTQQKEIGTKGHYSTWKVLHKNIRGRPLLVLFSVDPVSLNFFTILLTVNKLIFNCTPIARKADQGRQRATTPAQDRSSRLLIPAEQNYLTTEREALAVVWALEKFRGYVENQEIIIASDQKPLKWLMSIMSPSGRLARWVLQIQSFNPKIEYAPRKSNVLADMLYRPTNLNEDVPCDVFAISADFPVRRPRDIREEQLNDQELKKIIDCFENSSKDENFANWTSRGYLMNQGILTRYSSRRSFLRYGLPRRLIRDNGSQFVSAVKQHTCNFLGIKQDLIPLYHPLSNPSECKNRDLKPRFAILVRDEHDTWDEKLPMIRFALNTSRCETTNHTAAYLQFGGELRTTDDVTYDLRALIDNDNFVAEITPYLKWFAHLTAEIKNHVEQNQDKRKAYSDRQRRQVFYKPGDLVWVTLHPVSKSQNKKNRKFMPKREGPYLVITNRSPTTYDIADPAKPDEILGTYRSSPLRAYEFSVARDSGIVASLRRRGRSKKFRADSSPRRRASQRGSL